MLSPKELNKIRLERKQFVSALFFLRFFSIAATSVPGLVVVIATVVCCWILFLHLTKCVCVCMCLWCIVSQFIHQYQCLQFVRNSRIIYTVSKVSICKNHSMIYFRTTTTIALTIKLSPIGKQTKNKKNTRKISILARVFVSEGE